MTIKSKLKLKNFPFSLLGILFLCSCSLMNSKSVTVPITSNPPGATLYIDGQIYGQTPTSVTLEPSRTYNASLVKDGYGSAKFDMETWYSVRGGRGGDTTRCVLDSLGTIFIIPAIASYSSGKCRDFTKESYDIIIPDTGYKSPNTNSTNSKSESSNYNQSQYSPYNYNRR